MSEKTLMPETLFALLKSKINKIRTTAFLSALLCGIAAHFYRITNWLPNWDSLVFATTLSIWNPSDGGFYPLPQV